MVQIDAPAATEHPTPTPAIDSSSTEPSAGPTPSSSTARPAMILGDPSTDSEAVTQEGLLPPEPADLNSLPDPAGPVFAGTPSGDSVPTRSGQTADADEAGADDSSTNQTAAIDEGRTSHLSDSFAAFESESRRQTRRWIGIASLAVLVLLTIATLVFWAGKQSTSDSVAGQPASTNAPSDGLSDQPIGRTDDTPEVAENLAGNAAEKSPPVPHDSKPDIEATSAQAGSAFGNPNPGDPVQTDTDFKELLEPSDANVQNDLPTQGASMPDPVRLADSRDAANLVAAQDQLRPIESSETERRKPEPEQSGVVRPTANQDPELGDDIPPELAAFTQLLDLPGQNPDQPPMLQAEPEQEELPVLEEAAEEILDPMLIATPPPSVNIDHALKLRLALQTPGYPLADVVLLVGELTQIPIQLDWVTLDLAGIEIDTPVRDRQSGWKTVGDWLDDVVDQIGATLLRDEGRLELTLTPDTLREKAGRALQTEDFGETAQEASDWIDAIVSDAPMNELNRIHLRVLATESLRRMRGLAPQLPNATMQRWTAELSSPIRENGANGKASNWPDRWPVLDAGEPGPQLDSAISLVGMLRRTARANDVRCVVQWSDARRRRVSPGQLVMPFAGQPAGEMLQEMLQPLGLQVRVVDPGHWWVGTPATYDRLPILVSSWPLGPAREAIMQKIRSAAAAAAVPVMIQHDPESDRFLALMPRFFHRQLPVILSPSP